MVTYMRNPTTGSYALSLWVTGLKIIMFQVMFKNKGSLGAALPVAIWRTVIGYLFVHLLLVGVESLTGASALVGVVLNIFTCYMAIEFVTAACLLYLVRSEMDECVYMIS